jgi:competence ComEA-like helix-hairpin-helix protein
MEEMIERGQEEEAREEGAKVNLNTATVAELRALPGIGPTYAQRIIEYRQQKKPFTDIAQIKEVQGIGEALYARINDRLTVGAKISEQVPTEEVKPTGGEAKLVGGEVELAREKAERTREEPVPGIKTTKQPSVIGGVWWELAKGLLIVVLSTLLGAAISLGLIYAYNGTLDFSKHRDTVALKAQAEKLQRASASLGSDLEATVLRVEDLEEKVEGFEELKKDVDSLKADVGDLSKDVKSLKTDVSNLNRDVEMLQIDVGDLQKDVEVLRIDVSELQKDVELIRQEAARVNSFLDALRDLLIETQGVSIPAPTPTTW